MPYENRLTPYALLIGFPFLFVGAPFCIACILDSMSTYPQHVLTGTDVASILSTIFGALLFSSGLTMLDDEEDRRLTLLYGRPTFDEALEARLAPSTTRLWAAGILFTAMLLIAVTAGCVGQHNPQDLYHVPFTNWLL